mmetsp:Transcript_79135/g.183619  ORF Transcript_79135/g.183619 Transcript_79135/m.183619 type:complete len:226 (-) Transcript_79135:1479-2156(-)
MESRRPFKCAGGLIDSRNPDSCVFALMDSRRAVNRGGKGESHSGGATTFKVGNCNSPATRRARCTVRRYLVRTPNSLECFHSTSRFVSRISQLLQDKPNLSNILASVSLPISPCSCFAPGSWHDACSCVSPLDAFPTSTSTRPSLSSRANTTTQATRSICPSALTMTQDFPARTSFFSFSVSTERLFVRTTAPWPRLSRQTSSALRLIAIWNSRSIDITRSTNSV